MIDNVVMIITGVTRGEELDRDELIDKCHPLGMLDIMPALTLSHSLPDLYNSVLIETPIGPYFREGCASIEDGKDDLEEMNIELVRLGLWKAYLEDFHHWCTTVADEATAETMGQLLSFEADRRILNMTISAVGTNLTKDTRLSLFPRIGSLYEAGITDQLAACDDLGQLRQLIGLTNPTYRPLLDAAINAASSSPKSAFGHGGQTMPNGRFTTSGPSFESLAAEYEIELCKEAFLRQFCFTPFYAWCKLREQEARNIVWIAECIAQQQKENIHNYIPIF